MEGDFGDAVELHFGSMAPGGYAWMFPKSSGANIGLGIQRSFSKGRSLNDYTEDFISKYDGEISFNGAGSLPMSGTIKKFVKGNYVLVGDSAGMVLPSKGGNYDCNDWRKNRWTSYRRASKSGLPLEEYEKNMEEANGQSNAQF